MFHNPIIASYRTGESGDTFSGVFTLCCPSKKVCIICGWLSDHSPKPSEIRELITYVRKLNKKELIFYREKNGVEIRKEYKI